jgi:DNA invertase Pin-like site-specific DNA recombinase
MTDLIRIVERIETKGATLRILAMNLDTATPTGTWAEVTRYKEKGVG